METKNIFEERIERDQADSEAVVKDFLSTIEANILSKDNFIINKEKWLVCYRPYTHSPDIIVDEREVKDNEKFLLVREGSDRTVIYGWCDKKLLTSVPARDIYRNGTKCYVVMDINLSNLSSFKIHKANVKLKKDFIINAQLAENLGHSEMISGILAGLHSFAKKSNLYFKDINQKDEGVLGDKKFKIYTRDAFSDEDMLIPNSFYLEHPEIDFYIMCKIKAGQYNYLGYIEKNIVDITREVQMTGNVDMDSTGEKIRRIFAEQYKNVSDLIQIWEEEKKEEIKIEQQEYFPLHMHSEFSIGDGFGKVDYITTQLKLRGFKGAALTDHGTLAGVWEFQKACLAKDLKPIIGIEAYVKLDLKEEKRFHITILVKNNIGWKNILKLHAISVLDNFYYRPLLLFEDLLKYGEGLVIASGCSSGIFYDLLKNKKETEAELLLDRAKEVFKEDFYIEIMSHEILENQTIMQKLFELSKKKNIKCIFTTDSHYPTKEDIKYHKAVKAINLKKKYEEAGFSDSCFFLMQKQDIIEKLNREETKWMLPYYQDFLKNTFEIADKCNFRIEPVAEIDTLPKFKVDESKINQEYIKDFESFMSQDVGEDLKKGEKLKLNSIDKFFITVSYDGLKNLNKFDDKIYFDRLRMELVRIIKKKYSNYFLIMWTVANFCNERKIMRGTGRGSVAACLVALSLNITTIDPIEYNLLWDRFISSIRKDFVDIDSDYEDGRREEVFDFLKETAGHNHYAKVITYSKFHPKGILRDCGRIFDIPHYEINKICSMVLERSSGDARASFSLQDTFAEFDEARKFKEKYVLASDVAMKLEGNIRHRGVHAAAIILTEQETNCYAPITKVGGEICFEWEKQLCEDMHLIKYDILGLKTLSVIRDAVESAKISLPTNLEDIKVYKNVFKNNMVGIFQWAQVGMQKFTSEMNIEKFADLSHCCSLFRPSCLHSGQAQTFSNRQSGKEPVVYLHPSLENLTKATKGVLIYQEQIMKIMNEVAGLSWATSEMSRKVMTKSKGKDALNKIRQDFVNGAFKVKGIAKEDAEKLFDIVSTFGSYGFNEAHSISYSKISYYCAWLKTYYPKYFYKALLKYETDDAEIKNIIQDMKRNKAEIEYPEINTSDFSYELFNDRIYAGLNSIGGIGDKIAQKIIKGRPYVGLEDLKKKTKVSKKILKGLIVADAFREFKINKRASIEGKDAEDYDDIELSQLIYQCTSLTPKIDIKKSYDFGNYDFKTVEELAKLPGSKQYFLRGIVTDVLNKDKLLRAGDNKHVHHFERHLIYLNINDGTGNIACQFNPETYEKFSKLVEVIKKQPVVVYGTTTKDGKKIYCDLIQIVSKEFRTDEVDKVFASIEQCGNGEAIITASRPAVSKNGNSYYRITLHNGVQGLCFKFKEKLFPGMMVQYFMTQEPFINLKILKVQE